MLHRITRHSSTALLAVALLLPACSSDTSSPPPADGAGADAGADALLAADGTADSAAVDGGDAQPGGVLRIYIEGDLTPRTFTDGYAGQTPKVYAMGLGRFEIMTSAADPAPVTVFDHGAKPVAVDLLSRTLGGQARLADLPAGSYTHARVLLTHSAFTVAATVHAGLSIPGDLEVIAALSDTTVGGKPLQQGQALFTFKVGAAAQSIPGALPPLPSTAGGTIQQSGGKTWMTFPFPKPLVIAPQSTQDHEATILYMVYRSFRWQDQTTSPAYKSQVFDLDAVGLTFEPVKNFGATGYAVVTK